MANPAPTLNQINAFNATQGTIVDFNIIGGTELVRSNRIYIYDLSDNSLICTHLYVSTESIHELPANTDSSIVYESGKSSADFVNGAQYYAQIQTYTDTAGTEGGSGLSVAKMFWCLVDPTLTITTIPSTISTTSYNVSATYNANTSVVPNIIQQYQFNLYSATGSLLQSSGVVVGSGTQQGTSTAYDISYNFTGLNVGSSYYVTVEVTTTQGMSVSAQSNTFTVSVDTPTVGGAIVNNNACDGYISVVSNLSDEYGGSASGEMASFETDSVNNVSSLKVNMEPIQEGSGTPSPTNVRLIRGHSGVNAYVSPTQSADDGTKYSQEFDVSLTPTSTDKVPYMFKAVGRDVYGDRESDKIVGGTVAWNQLVENVGKTTQTINGVTFTALGNGLIRVSGTATADTRYNFNARLDFLKGHVYITVGVPNDASTKTHFAYVTGVVTADTVKKYTEDDYWGVRITVKSGVTVNNAVYGLMCFDLTQMFGSTIADAIYSLEQATTGAGVAWFKKLFPKPYYAYNAGELMSVNASSHNTVGFNAWDEEWESGSYTANGVPTTDPTRIRTKNPIRVIGGTTYYMKSSTTLGIRFYDVEGNFIDGGYTTTVVNTTVTTPANAYWLRFSVVNQATYNHDICINLSDPSRNGEYEPYQKHTYLLDSSLTLRGMPKLDANNNLYYDGDTYESDGTVTRKWGFYTIQTSDITLDDGGGYTNVVCAKIQNLPSMLRSNLKQAIHSKYGVSQVVWPFDDTSNIGKLANNPATQAYWFIFPIGTTIEQMRTTLVGTTLAYELATPTTETADPYTNPQIIDPYGTEEYVTTGIVPVGHNTTYLTRDIFGGTLDLVTGVLTVDRAMVTLDGTQSIRWEDWRHFDNNTSAWLYGQDIFPIANSNDITCDKLATVEYVEIYSGNVGISRVQTSTSYSFGVRVSVGGLTTVSAINAYLAENPIEVVYPLATPQTYQLTPHQIQTLVGQNNVWSDAGDVDVTFNLPISNLLVKRQDASDVSGDWLTLYSQPITQASDMDFTYIDFLNQHGKTYRYALVPLLTQTQSGVEVEVEGGYTVSDEVQSIFDGVFIADQTGSQKCKANVGYGDVDMNQAVGTITPIGAKYPVVITNSKNQYHNGSISGTIVPDDYYFNGNLSRIDMVNKRNELEQFLTNKRAKIIKDWNSNIWLVMITENINCTFNNEYGMGIVNFNANWIEVGDPTNQQDLQATGLIDVGGV